MKQIKVPNTDEYSRISTMFNVDGFFGPDGLLNTTPLIMNMYTNIALPINLNNTPNYI